MQTEASLVKATFFVMLYLLLLYGFAFIYYFSNLDNNLKHLRLIWIHIALTRTCKCHIQRYLKLLNPEIFCCERTITSALSCLKRESNSACVILHLRLNLQC